MERLYVVTLTQDEIDALLYAISYTEERDDEGVRSSEPEAMKRTEDLESAAAALSIVEKGGGRHVVLTAPRDDRETWEVLCPISDESSSVGPIVELSSHFRLVPLTDEG